MLNYLKNLTPTGRITLAIVASLVLHAVFVSSSMIKLPKPEFDAPTMTATLEPLKTVGEPAPIPDTEPTAPVTKAEAKPKAAAKKPAATPEPEAPQITPAEAPTQAQAEEKPEPAPETATTNETPTEATPSEPAVAQQTPTAEAEQAVEDPGAPPRQLPTRIKLTFDVYDSNNNKQGEVEHKLMISNNHYVLSSALVGGPFGAFKRDESSHGTFDRYGFRPTMYSQEITRGFSKQSFKATLDWTQKALTLTDGNNVHFPPNTQDFLSWMYQLSQLPLQNRSIQMSLTNARGLEQYSMVVEAPEILELEAGRVRTIKLSKVHGENQEGTEIWLASEYSLLPVQLRQIARNGSVSFELRLNKFLVTQN